jgi:hypothetical protein
MARVAVRVGGMSAVGMRVVVVHEAHSTCGGRGRGREPVQARVARVDFVAGS